MTRTSKQSMDRLEKKRAVAREYAARRRAERRAAAVAVEKPPPRPAQCRMYVRARFAEALPVIMNRLLGEARKGSLPHLRFLLQLSGLDKAKVVPRPGRPQGKSLEEFLREAWESGIPEMPAGPESAEATALCLDGACNGNTRTDDGEVG